MQTRIVQIGMCAADLPRTVRRYCEAFGFQDAGGRMLWGPRSAKIQEIGEDASATVWWLVGAQAFFNLEFFHHTLPAQRPLPADWLPNTLGWARFGVAVADFDNALASLRSTSTPLSETIVVDNLRRVCFRDPDLGVFIELMEEGATLPRPAANAAAAPRVVYVTLSVADLAAARAFYVNALEMTPAVTHLHTPEMEMLWGLADAKRDLLLLDGGGVFLELVQYRAPAGKRRGDARLSDQGIMNISMGYRDRAAIGKAVERAVAAGATLNAPLLDYEAVATYMKDTLGNSVEMICMPAHLDRDYGFASRAPAYR